MSSLFVSYSRRDIEAARRLTAAFEGLDLTYWIDWEGIPLTVDWWKEIEKGIEESDIFLFLLSPDSCRSPVCRKEVEYAARNGKRLIPVVVRDLDGEDPPAGLGALNWTFLRPGDDFDSTLPRLVASIRTDYAWAQAHRRLQNKALEWDRGGRDPSLLLRGRDLQQAEAELVGNSSKEPHPTDLQRRYVLESRQAAGRQQVRNAGIAAGVIVALAVLSVLALVQRGVALTNAAIAQTEQARAEANALLAEERATIALSRQLAAQAQSEIGTGDPSRYEGGILLAILSMQLYPVIDSALLLSENRMAYPLTGFFQDDVVYAAAFSPDGGLVASGSGDNTVRLWDRGTGAELARMDHGSDVKQVAFSPDGTLVASGSPYTDAHLWDVATHRRVASLPHPDGTEALAFSPDGTRLVTGGSGDARVWEVPSGRELLVIRQEVPVEQVAFSPDGTQVVLFNGEGETRSYDAISGEEVASFASDARPWSQILSADGRYGADIRSGTISIYEVSGRRQIAQIGTYATNAAFSPDNRYLVTSSDVDGKTVYVWRIATGRRVAMAYDETAWETTSVAMSPDNRYILSTDWDGRIRFWRLHTGQEVARMDQEDTVMTLGFTRDSTKLLAGGWDSTARIWDVATGAELARFLHRGVVVEFAVTPDGAFAVTNDGDRVARIWDVAAAREIARITHAVPVTDIALSPDGSLVVSAAGDGTIRISQTAGGRQVAAMQHGAGVSAVAFSPDGASIVTAGDDGMVRIWEAASGRELSHLAHDRSVYLVAYSPDGGRVASVSAGGIVHIWEVPEGHQVAAMLHGASLDTVSFSPDGSYVLSAGGCDRTNPGDDCIQGTARVWQAATGREMAWMAHDNEVVAAAFSPDGIYVASGSWDGTIRIWVATTGQEVARITLDNEVYSLAFSPDGSLVASGEFRRLVQLWRWRPEDVIADACSRLARNLTGAEWERYVGNALSYRRSCPGLPVPVTRQAVSH